MRKPNYSKPEISVMSDFLRGYASGEKPTPAEISKLASAINAENRQVGGPVRSVLGLTVKLRKMRRKIKPNKLAARRAQALRLVAETPDVAVRRLDELVCELIEHINVLAKRAIMAEERLKHFESLKTALTNLKV